MPKDVTVESFELDHTIVKAPYVRLISEEVGPKGDIITNFDIRLIQPNENSIDTGGLHTIEHLLAKLIRQRIDGLIDCSPFGCRTGFHMIMWGKQDSTEIAKVIKSSLEAIANEITWEMFQELPLNHVVTTRITVFIQLRNGLNLSLNKVSQTKPSNVIPFKKHWDISQFFSIF